MDAVISLPVETFVSSGASVKASVLFLRKYKKDESRRLERERSAAIEDALERHQAERIILLEANASKKLLAEFDAMIDEEALSSLKKALDYSVFFGHARRVGISATGGTTENDLPEVAQGYREFRKKNPLRFGAVV